MNEIYTTMPRAPADSRSIRCPLPVLLVALLAARLSHAFLPTSVLVSVAGPCPEASCTALPLQILELNGTDFSEIGALAFPSAGTSPALCVGSAGRTPGDAALSLSADGAHVMVACYAVAYNSSSSVPSPDVPRNPQLVNASSNAIVASGSRIWGWKETFRSVAAVNATAGLIMFGGDDISATPQPLGVFSASANAVGTLPDAFGSDRYVEARSLSVVPDLVASATHHNVFGILGLVNTVTLAVERLPFYLANVTATGNMTLVTASKVGLPVELPGAVALAFDVASGSTRMWVTATDRPGAVYCALRPALVGANVWPNCSQPYCGVGAMKPHSLTGRRENGSYVLYAANASTVIRIDTRSPIGGPYPNCPILVVYQSDPGTEVRSVLAMPGGAGSGVALSPSSTPPPSPTLSPTGSASLSSSASCSPLASASSSGSPSVSGSALASVSATASGSSAATASASGSSSVTTTASLSASTTG
jgi:hypothetical protein